MVMRKGIHFEPTEPPEEPEGEDDSIPEYTLGESIMIYLIIFCIVAAIIYLGITN